MINLVIEVVYFVFVFKQQTAYEMRISDWSSGVFSSDLPFIGMLYLGEGVMALRYLAVSFAVYVLPPLVAHAGLLPVDAETAVVMLVVACRLGGAIHCERVARRRAGEIQDEWFASW